MVTKPRKRDALLNIRISEDLKSWVKRYAQDKNTSVAQLVMSYFTELKKTSEAADVPQL